MKKQLLSVLFSFIALFLSASSAMAADSPCNWGNYTKANTTYLSPNASDSNQTQINSAIAAAPSGGSVYLRTGTFTISGPITMKSNVTLEGDKDAIIKLKDHAGWKTPGTTTGSGTCTNYYIPLIGSTSPYKTGVQNVEIKCFTLDGNFDGNVSAASEKCYYPSVSGKKRYNSCMGDCENATNDRWMGLGYYVMVFFTGSTSVSVHDMVLQNGFTDGLKMQSSSDIRFYNNTVTRLGHDGLFAASSNAIQANNNKVWARTNSAFRLQDTYDANINDNYITNFGRETSGYLSGRHYGSGPGIELDKQKAASKMTNINVYNNVFTQNWGPGIWLAAVADPNGASININHNIFFKSGMNQSIRWVGGIVSNNFTGVVVENNTFDENYSAALSTEPMIGGTSVITFRNNIVTNTHKGNGTGVGGYAIYNPNGSNITSQNNCFYNNVSGNTSGSVNASGDFTANPLFYKIGTDYHLMSIAGRWDPALSSWVSDAQNSPGIDAGLASSDYSKEPQNNGGRVNVGRYGNTSQASLTGNVRQNPMPPAPIADTFSTGSFAVGETGITGGTAYVPGTSTGGVGAGSYTGMEIEGGGGEVPDYYDPGTAVTAPDYYNPIDPTLPVPEREIADLFPELGESASTATAACGVSTETNGLVPCGRNTDNPDTAWNECDECDFCAAVLMGQLIIAFFFKMAVIAATLAIIFAGLLYMFAAGKTDTIAKAKAMIKYTLIGFVIIFAAWAAVDSMLTILGYIDPVGGEWYTIC